MKAIYVNYGCGNNAPLDWENFDASPTLLYERINPFVKNRVFPKNVKYGNIIKGLPIKENSCSGVYASHVLEHLSFNDFITSLKNTYKILKQGGIFRLLMPDLKYYINIYIENKNKGEPLAAQYFIENTLLGIRNRPKNFIQLLVTAFGNSKHLWLWDKEASIFYLKQIGFKNIQAKKYGEYIDDKFREVDLQNRYNASFCLEMEK